MDCSHDFDNGNVLSQSYIEGVKRITGNEGSFEDDFKISEEVFESRAKTWSWLFEKFSEISDDIELNIRTLQPDTESGDSYSSDIRIPIRKSAAQLQYWIDTGNPPCQAEQFDANDTDETVSISESEATDFDEDRSLPSASMIVNQKLANSGEQFLGTGSSASSVDTTAYILNNGNGARKGETDSRVSQNLGNLDNNIVGRSVNALSRVTVLPNDAETHENTLVLCKSTSAGNEEDRISRAEMVVSANIVVDKNDSDESDQIWAKTSKPEIKDCEVTLESKESGIGSSTTQNMENGESNEAKTAYESSSKVATLANQSMLRRRRKLFTTDNDCLDLVLTSVRTTSHQNRSYRMSLHPALDPPTSGENKARNRPRFSAKSGVRWRTRRSVNYSVNKRNKNKSVLSKSRAHRTSRILRSDTLKSAVLVETSVPPEVKDPDSVIGYTDTDTLKSAAPIETNIPIEDKDSDQTIRYTRTDTLKSAAPIQTDIPVEDKGTNPTVNADADVVERSNEDKVSSPSSSTKMKKRVTSKSLVNSSSSLSSNDASQIINEELTKISETSFAVVSKKNLTGQFPVVEIPRSQSEDSDNDQGSIFNVSSDSLLKTKKTKMQSMMHVKKNLCVTDLRSSEDSISNASTIFSDSGNRNKSSKSSKNSFNNDLRNSAEFNPRVILHDFLNLKNCCGKLDKENNQNWLQKRNKRFVLRSGMKAIHEETKKINDSEKNAKSVKSKKEMNQKVPVNKKPKMVNKAISSERHPKTSCSANVVFHTEDPPSSEEKTSDLRTERAEDYCDHSATRDSTDGKISNGDNPTVIFTNTNHNRWESIFALTSSDEEDILKKLSITSKSKSLRKESAGSHETGEPSTGVTTDPRGSEMTRTRQESYRIVSSSSEEEEKTVRSILRSRRLTRKNSKRNKRKDSMESELTMRLTKDECEDGSENLRNDDDKGEKQLPGVNSKRPERKKSKQSREACKDYPVARKEANGQTRSNRKLRAGIVDKKNSEKSEIRSSEKANHNRVILEMNDKENDPNNISENSETPVHRIANSRRKRNSRLKNGANKCEGRIDSVEDQRDEESEDNSGISLDGMKIKMFRKIARAAESPHSLAESEVGRIPNYKDRRKASVEIENADNSTLGVIRKAERASTALKLHYDDESSDDDDAMNLFSKNYAGDNSRDKGNRRKDRDVASEEIGSYKHPDSLNKCGNDAKRRFTRSSEKKITNRLTSSKIVFRTKEYWESDSDNC